MVKNLFSQIIGVFAVSLGILITFSTINCQSKIQKPQLPQEIVCVLKTNMGTMVIRFFEKDAPNTCRHFQDLVNQGFYNGKDFYRVVKGHVIQAGGGGEKIKAEYNKNKHVLGTVGLGRGNDPDSGDSEFYICLAPRPHLDEKYTVFGQLIEDYDVLYNIANVEVDEKFAGQIAINKPKKPVIIEKATIETRPIK